MTAQTATLTDFLLARIAEDEHDAHSHECVCPEFTTDGQHFAFCPQRVWAECEAKRRIVKFHESWPVLVETTPPEFEPSDPTDLQSMTFHVSQQIAWMTVQQYRERFGDESPAGPVLRALASVYVDHPDFNPEWRA